jgi:sRNA-binding protein
MTHNHNGAKHKDNLAVIELLAETFPACFFVLQQRRRPLKLGIFDDVLAALDGVATAKEIALALRLYTSNGAYLRACKEGEARIDLNGNAVGCVTTEEASHARERLAQRKAKYQRHREALAKEKAVAERKARNAGRISLAGLRAAAQARRAMAGV